ncbi:MAG: FAD-binding oxidoreductase [Steroidobacteraceae bacterium]
MRTLYSDTAEAAPATPPLAANANADVVVVGAGYTGLSAALHLAQDGASVIVLEAEEAGWGASGRNGGQVNPGLKPDPDRVESDFAGGLGERMNALAGGAPSLVFDLIARHGIACEARRTGTLRAAVHPGHAAQLAALTDQYRRRDAPVELLRGAALEQATGTGRYAAAMFDRRGGNLNPSSYTHGLARATLDAGAVVHGKSRAKRLVRHGSRWAVEAGTARVNAAHVVLATNGYTDDLWPALRRSVVPVFGAIAATAPLPSALAQRILPGRPVLYESGTVTVYYRVDAANRLLIGGRGPQREIDTARAVPNLLAYAQRLWPDLEVTWTHGWGGRLAMSRDHYPHLHEPAPGLLAGLAYNGRGIALATAMGRQIARRILEPGAVIDMPVTAVEPIGLHALWPLAVHAAIARGRVCDMLGL